MMIKFATLLSLVSAALAVQNPHVVSPQHGKYNAGDVMRIEWEGAGTGFVNIDVVGKRGVLDYPQQVAIVPASQGHYDWKLPSGLKDGGHYHVRVWGDHQPVGEKDGLSKGFDVVNKIPDAVNKFMVTAPNAQHPCYSGKPCEIKWDFSQSGVWPAMVDIAAYRVGSNVPIAQIGTVSSHMKSYVWNVPADASLEKGQVYISVSGQGIPLSGPGASNDMAGNSHAFAVSHPAAEEAKDGKDGKMKGMGLDEEDKKSDHEEEDEDELKLEKEEPEDDQKVERESVNNPNGASQIASNAGKAVTAAFVFALASLLF